MHLGVREQAMVSSSADTGTCETWPSFWHNISTPSHSQEGKELQGQQERLAATGEYFIAKDGFKQMHFRYTHHLISEIHDKVLIPLTTLCKGGWSCQEHCRSLPYKLTRDQQQNSAVLGDRKQVQEGQRRLFPTMCNKLARWSPHLISYTNALSQQNQMETDVCQLSVQVTMYNCKENGRTYRSSETKAKTFS